jgi:Spy/CpxP family protein refolding chaperone
MKFAATAALSASLMFAQGFRPRDNGGAPPDPATMVQMKVAHLTALLTLNTAQQTQASTLFGNAVTASQNIHTSLQTNRDSLTAAIKANNSASIDQLAASMGTLQGQLTSINAKADAAFRALLTADQQTAYDSMPHGPGGPGGGPGPGGPPPQ